MHDVLIIGGGISGFYCGLETLKHNKNVVICEKYKSLGGRVSTYYHNDSIFWESGAGRISDKHKLLLDLCKKYDHQLVKIGKDIVYKDTCLEPNIFETLIPSMIEPLRKLPTQVIQNSTIKELLVQVHGKEKAEDYLNRFPYRAEVEVLRADLGIETFQNEMGSHEGYYVSKIGLSKLIDSMKDDFLKHGGQVLYNYECINIVDKKEYIDTEFLTGSRKEKHRSSETIRSSRVVCAMESEALKKIPLFKGWKILEYLRMEPLLRTYAIYDTPWFSQLPRVVTPNTLRYFLPISYDKNIAMVSYTDSRDTEHFHKIAEKYGEQSLGDHIHKLLKNEFGDVPKHNFFKQHYWKYGATYWLPGNYSVKDVSIKSLKPFDCNIFVVGESFSLKQAWIEGALEQCVKLFKEYKL